MAKSGTLHDLTAVRIDAGRQLVLIDGQMLDQGLLMLTMHRRILGGLIPSLIQAHGNFPRAKDSEELPIQPLKLSGAAAIAIDNGERVVGLELQLGDGLSLQVIIPEDAMKPLRSCLDSLIVISTERDPKKPNGS